MNKITEKHFYLMQTCYGKYSYKSRDYHNSYRNSLSWFVPMLSGYSSFIPSSSKRESGGYFRLYLSSGFCDKDLVFLRSVTYVSNITKRRIHKIFIACIDVSAA